MQGNDARQKKQKASELTRYLSRLLKVLRTRRAGPHYLLVSGLLLAVILGGCGQEGLEPFAGSDNIASLDVVAQAEQIIRQGLFDADPLIRVNAIEVVAQTGQIKLMPKVQHLLQDDFVPVRVAAAVAVGDVRYVLAKPKVAILLNDRDENVRIAAAYAMYKLGDTDAFEILRKAIASKDQTVRANAAWLLGKTGNQEGLKVLYIALNMPDSDDKVRYQAVESIARLGDERIYEKIWTMLISGYADVRVMGVLAMGALGTPKARDSLLSLLDDGVPEVRLRAAEQLGKLGSKAGEKVVLKILKKKNSIPLSIQARERIDVLTALAIGQICTDRLRKYLPRYLASDLKRVRLAAAEAIFRCINRSRSNGKP